MSRARLRFVVAAAVLLFALPADADRGIGGTYVPPPPRPAPGSTTRPLGTTIVGTIVKFGSVHVNDVVLDVPDMKGLALGQTVRLHAPDAIAQRMTADRVELAPSLTGPVDAVYARGALTVLGRKVAIDRATFVEDGLRLDEAGAGTMLTVYGLDRADGSLQATRVERAAAGAVATLRGRLTPAPDGTLAVQGIKLRDRAPADWIGQVVVAKVDAARRVVVEAALWDALTENVETLSLEGVLATDARPDAVTIEGTTILLDRNTIVRNADLLRADRRVVIEATHAPDGRWRAARIEAPPAERVQPALPTLPPDLPFAPPPPAPPAFNPSSTGPASLVPGKK